MNQQNLINSEVRAEPAASKKHPLIKLGLDVHADTIVVVRILDHSAPQPGYFTNFYGPEAISH